jgi:hypothetical protein
VGTERTEIFMSLQTKQINKHIQHSKTPIKFCYSQRSMSLQFWGTRPLTEINTRNFLRQRVAGAADNLTAICEPIV